MLQALLHKKLKDSFADPHFRPSEDTMTSSVIGLMQYLPDNVFWQILKQACGLQSNLPKDIGSINDIYFWDKWNAVGTGNSNFVEPDVWIDSEGYDIIIEAKKTDSWVLQHADQWENEITALLNERDDDSEKGVIFIALGGNESLYDTECLVNGRTYQIHTASWFNLLHASVAYRENNDDRNINRLLLDIEQAFMLHGCFQMEWLNSMPDKKIRNTSIDVLKNGYEFDNHNMFLGMFKPKNRIRKTSIKLWQR